VATALLDLSVLATEARTRGIGRYVGDLARGLAGISSPDVRVLGLEHLSWLGSPDVTEDLRGAVERLTSSKTPMEPHASWAYRLRVGLAAATRAVAPDLVHTGHPNATPLGNLGCPRVTTCHDLIPLRYPQHYLDWRDGFRQGRELLDYRRFHSAAHVIAVSETTANDLTTLLGVAGSKITVVYNGVDLAKWSAEPGDHDREIRAKHGVSESSYVLCVGAADWRKNHESVLHGLGRARARAPEAEIVLCWAARLDSSTQSDLRRAARAHGVADALRLIGYVDDEELAALYRGASAQLFPSRAEGFGYPVIEAMSAGCPVITSDRSSLVEVAGDAAILVDPEDSEAIEKAILRLVEDDDERRRLSVRGSARAKQFSIERMARETLEVYKRVILETRASAA
jgi:glycosyltransferase involved in cell wall biosynthesis